MRKPRKHYSPAEKVALLKRHLVDGEAVSKICDEHQVQPTLFYLWQKIFFENGAAAFENTGKRHKSEQDAKDRHIAQLQEKLQRKNEVVAELMEEHVQLKKARGEP